MNGPTSEQPTLSPRPMTPIGAIFWTFLFVLLVTIARKATIALRSSAEEDIVNILVCHLFGLVTVLFATARVYGPETPLRSMIAFRRISFLMGFFSLVAGCAFAMVLDKVDVIIEQRFPLDPKDMEFMTNVLTIPTLKGRVGLTFGLSVVIPVVEEIFFRGALFTSVRRQGSANVAIVATVAAFALLHASQREIFQAVLAALFLGWLRAQTGSVVVPILASVAQGVVGAIPFVIGRGPFVQWSLPPVWLGASAIALGLALVFIRARAHRDVYAEEARAADG